jgi:hypothetical protein
MLSYLSSSAVISACSCYRYLLRRTWDDNLPPYVLGMLNPSTADADFDDPTITRSVRRAASLGHGSLIVWNLYAFRATDPAKLRQAPDPVGSDNTNWIRTALQECSTREGNAIVGWGGNAINLNAVAVACRIAEEVGVSLQCLGVTKDGHPKHPLYVSYGTVLQSWRFAGS